MKILLVAINAKYIHSNLAIYSLKAYCKKHREKIILKEYTINNQAEDILKGIYMEKPEVVAFSCYIWNTLLVDQLGKDLKQILPETAIWVGGPEVSYNGMEQLEMKPWVSGIILGEGEETFSQLVDYWVGERELEKIKGIAYRRKNKEGREALVEKEKPMPLLMESLPFPYEKISEFKNKIIYYETSRGCPFSCSYCLSSIEKRVRFRNLKQIKKELKFFMDNQVSQVKFIDRTFNCNANHAMEIWRFIYENDNGITNFHFEISADLLSEEEIQWFKGFRPGLVQFEIGVQSIHPKTIHAICRTMNLDKLTYAVKRIREGGNVHQHLDLIAGLPYEDFVSFQASFDFVYGLKPDQLQLGFLKVLKGSYMFQNRKEYNLIYTHTPPYEVLSTKWLSYEDILALKGVEEMVEVYYNSGQFTYGIRFLEHLYESPFLLYQDLSDFYGKNALDEVSHSRISRYHILLDFYQERWSQKSQTLEEILLFDLYLREKLKSRPTFAPIPILEKKEKQRIFEKFLEYQGSNQKEKNQMFHIEYFRIDIFKTAETGKPQEGDCYILFDYQERNPLTHQAKVICIEAEKLQMKKEE